MTGDETHRGRRDCYVALIDELGGDSAVAA